MSCRNLPTAHPRFRRAVGTFRQLIQGSDGLSEPSDSSSKVPTSCRNLPTAHPRFRRAVGTFRRLIQGSDGLSEPSDGPSKVPTGCRNLPTAHPRFRRAVGTFRRPIQDSDKLSELSRGSWLPDHCLQGVPGRFRSQRGGGDSLEAAIHAHPGGRLRRLEAHQEPPCERCQVPIRDPDSRSRSLTLPTGTSGDGVAPSASPCPKVTGRESEAHGGSEDGVGAHAAHAAPPCRAFRRSSEHESHPNA